MNKRVNWTKIKLKLIDFRIALSQFFKKVKEKTCELFEKIKTSKKAKIIAASILLVIIILVFLLCFRGCGSSSSRSSKNINNNYYDSEDGKSKSRLYNNTLKLVERYVNKGEYDRALDLLDNLLLENPDDENLLDLFEKVLDAKQNGKGFLDGTGSGNGNGSGSGNGFGNGSGNGKNGTNGSGNSGGNGNYNGNGGENGNSGGTSIIENHYYSGDTFNTETFSSAMQSVLDKQASENQKILEKALNESNRQNEKNQKAMQEILDRQAAQEEARLQAEQEKKEAEKVAAEQRKLEEEKRKKEEEELARKNAKLKSEIDGVNEQIKLGKTALEAGNPSDAAKYFSKAEKQLPISDGEPDFSASKLSEIGESYLEASDRAGNKDEKKKLLDEAVSYAQKSLSKNPNEGTAHYILGMNASENNDNAKALDELTKAVKYSPDNYLYWYNLGKTQYRMRKYNDAANSFTKCCNLNGQFAPGRYNLGLSYKTLKNDTAALDSFKKTIEINPYHENAYIEQARLLTKRGDYSGAVTSYKKVLEINNVNTTALMELGTVYHTAQKLALSEESYKRAITLLDSGFNLTSTCYNLSTVLFEEEKYTEAVSFAKKAYDGRDYISNEKLRANIIYNYALLLDATGKKTDAISIYLEVLKYDPDHIKTNINLGVMYLELDPPDADKALVRLSRAFQGDSKNIEVNNNLGKAYEYKEDYKNSIKYYQNAYKLSPNNNEILLNLARSYAKDEDYSNAKTTYQNVINADKQNWTAYIELAKVCMKLEDNENAEKYLLTVQKKQPDFHADEVSKLLEGLK